MTVLVYLDNCMFNRPFDNQHSVRIRLETEAKLDIQSQIRRGQLNLIWSDILDHENNANPYKERKSAIAKWKSLATHHVTVTAEIMNRVNQLFEHKIQSKDAIHVACAAHAKAEYFFSTDDKLLKVLGRLDIINAINPVDFYK